MTSTPRESSEWRAIAVELNGQAMTTNVEVCITPYKVRPTEADWQAATLRDGKTCVRVAGRAAGYWWGWGRGTSGDEKGVVGPFPFTIG